MWECSILPKSNFYWVGFLGNAHCPSYMFSGVSECKLKFTIINTAYYPEDGFQFNFFWSLFTRK